MIIIYSFSGCGSTHKNDNDVLYNEANSKTVFAMDTVMELTVYGDEKYLLEAENLIHMLEKKFSVTDSQSEIYALNKYGSASISDDTIEVISRTLKICERTDGVLDISVYPIVRAWGFTTEEYRVPDDYEILDLLKHVDYRKINVEQNTVILAENMKVDLGSVAKGYTGERISEIFKANGIKNAIINLGGNVQAVGNKPDGTPWRIAIKDPQNNGYAGVVSVIDKAVVTSGGYERYFEYDGVIYRHIIDTSTGYPVDNDILSVTIIGDDGLLCDALSTSLFAMGLDKASEFLENNNDVDAVLITKDNSIYITEGIENSFLTIGSYANANINVIRYD